MRYWACAWVRAARSTAELDGTRILGLLRRLEALEAGHETGAEQRMMMGEVSPTGAQNAIAGQKLLFISRRLLCRRLPGSSFRQNGTELPLRSELRTLCSSQQPPGPAVWANVEKDKAGASNKTLKQVATLRQDNRKK
jgi:hypothetical protein